MSISEIDKYNIINASMEELTEEEHKAYLFVEEHVKAQFLKGFKKDRGGLVKRVEEFVLPSLKLKVILTKKSLLKLVGWQKNHINNLTVDTKSRQHTRMR